jgi:NAD+ diphosphatase
VTRRAPTGRVHYLAGSPLDRRDDLRQVPDLLATLIADGTHVVVPVHTNQSLVRDDDPVHAAFIEGDEASELLAQVATVALLGEMDDRMHWLATVEESHAARLESNHGARFTNLRSVSPLLDQASAAILAHARALSHFHRHHQYCGRCGQPTALAGLGNWRRCSADACGHVTFPRTDPAIIVRLVRGDECLLVRQAEWRPRQFATVAGFVEPGESLEEAVTREVREETGLETVDVRYHSSQPWPFPSGIMIGFDAEVTGELDLGSHELEEGHWFTREEMVRARDEAEILLPSPYSISYELIMDWLVEVD